jgi:plastocyanin
MEDKCPQCGQVLITNTIKKELGQGSIFIPIGQVCPKCSWNKDLTGAGDIVPKPSPEGSQIRSMESPTRPAPAKPKHEQVKAKQMDMNKVITVALALIVIVGVAWAFIPKGEEPVDKTTLPVQTPTVTGTPVITATQAPEVTATGNIIKVRIDRDRGYINPSQKNLKIKAGDKVIWINDGSYSLTLISKDGLFENNLLNNEKEMNYTFKKAGTFNFDIKVIDTVKFSGTITSEP